MAHRARFSSRRLSAHVLIGLQLALLAANACKPEPAKVASAQSATEPAAMAGAASGASVETDGAEPDSDAVPSSSAAANSNAALDSRAAPDSKAAPDSNATPGAPASAPPSAETETRPAAPNPVIQAPAPSELIVGSEHGLIAYSFDGKHRRTISKGAALYPRWFDAAHVIVLVPRDPRAFSAGATLQRISLADGRRQQVATLPPFACKQQPTQTEDSFPYQVDLQDGRDFALAPAEGLVCLQLLDRNANMASVVLDVRIDLRTRRVERWLGMGEDLCAPPRGVRLGEPPNECTGGYAVAEPSSETLRAFAYDMPDANGLVMQTSAKGERPTLQLGLDYSPESYSPSGRWLVLGGDTEEGDYLYRRLSLLDRESGRVYPIIPGAAWPAALEPRRGSPPTLPPIERAILVPGETDVRWLGAPDGELLVVGKAIVRPGVGSFEVDGEVAR